MYVLKGLQTDELNETKEETTSHQDLEKLNHYIEETSKLDKENLALIAEIEQIKWEHQHIKVLIDNFATQKLKPKRKETKRKGVTFGRTQTFAPIKRKTVF